MSNGHPIAGKHEMGLKRVWLMDYSPGCYLHLEDVRSIHVRIPEE